MNLGLYLKRIRVNLDNNKEYFPVELQDFPLGTCGVVSEVLAEGLSKKFDICACYISGEIQAPFMSHAWLECRGKVIDLTADQFGQNNKYYEAPSEWYFLWGQIKKRKHIGPGDDLRWWQHIGFDLYALMFEESYH